MSLTPYMTGRSFAPETLQTMGVAFDQVRDVLLLGRANDVLTEIIAVKIIELADHGITDPAELKDMAIRELLGEITLLDRP